ncbi:terminase large subunit [Magnetospirillum sp. XM-1]|uniref:terminase large subunit n=1 Tax=Magnetospirillum sp. XM-1 TaxID=1663591 RepID=UPI0018D46F4A|nr:terminase TerL endonuclease subunit [Magnetospirillum sp. XM-1]
MSRADRMIAFIEGLKISSGMHAGRNFLLRPWQREIIAKIYATDADGHRPVRTALLTMARKQGKSALAAALALAHLVGPESVQRGQVFSAASDRHQAGLIFRELVAFIEADPELIARCNVIRHNKSIEDMETGSIYEALSSDAHRAHGLSGNFVIADELAQWQAGGRELYQALDTGQGAHDEPLMVVISTKSADTNSVMSELVQYGREVNAGTIVDPHFAAFIYEVPEAIDDVRRLLTDESLWALANPALGDFRSLADLRKAAKMALRLPAQVPGFRCYFLNQEVDATAEPIFPRDLWDACAGQVDRSELYGKRCWGGLDMSSAGDMSAFVLFFPDTGAVIARYWLPGDGLADRVMRDRAPYDVWRDNGVLDAPPGRAVDKRSIAMAMAEAAAEFDIAGIAYDRARIKDLMKLLDDEGIDLPLVDFGQGFISMAPAIDALEEWVLKCKLRHGNNAILRWNVANAKVEIDPAGNRKITKRKSLGRVDGLVSLAMAIGLFTREPPPPTYAFTGMVLNVS